MIFLSPIEFETMKFDCILFWLQPMHEIFAGLQSSKTSIFPRLTYPCSFLSHQVGKGELSLHGIPLCFHLCVRLLQISKGFLTLLSTKAQWILYSLFSPILMNRKLQNLTHVNSSFDQEYCNRNLQTLLESFRCRLLLWHFSKSLLMCAYFSLHSLHLKKNIIQSIKYFQNNILS